MPQFPAASVCINPRNQQNITPENTIYACSFDTQTCSFKDFEVSALSFVYASYYETCLRFNSGRNYLNQSSEIRSISRTKINSGLNLTFLLDGIVIYTFMLSKIYELRISIDHYLKESNQCIKQDTLDYVSDLFQYFIQQNKTYRQQDCFDLCILEFIMNKQNNFYKQNNFFF